MSLKNPVVLVVGAGPVGISLAADLLRHGVPCRIIDSAPEPSNLSKAVVVMPRTLEMFEMRGFAGEVLAVAQPMRGFMVYAEGRLIFHSHFHGLASRYNHLTCVGQSETERILRGQLALHGGDVEYGVTLEQFSTGSASVRCSLVRHDGTREELEVPWLVGCDGAHSTVRHALDLPFGGSGYKDVWALADVVIDWRFPRDHSCAFFHDEGYLAIFPMPENRSRIFAVRANDALMGKETTLEQMQDFMDRWVPIKSKLRDPRWLAQFHVQHRQVSQYRVGRVFLAGDAAHIHSPESGLGMNTGIQDAYNLAWKLALVHKGQAPESLLETYHHERHHVGHQVVQLSNAMHLTWAQFSPLGEKLRNRAFVLFNELYRVHYSTVEDQCQLAIDYHRVPQSLAEDHHHSLKPTKSPPPGRRALDCRLVDVATDKEIWLLRSMGEHPAHCLLMFTGMLATPQAFDQIRQAAAMAREYAIDLHVVLGRETPEALEGVKARLYYDASLECHELYALYDPCMYLVRPDGYIALRSLPMRADDLRGYLAKHFVKVGEREGAV